MAERLLDLGQGLAIYRFHVDELAEQDVNARSMKKEAFDRLTSTIEKDQRLEQLPFVAKTSKGFEIVGGHHRARSARRAGVTTIHGIVDETDLSRSAIAAKQLAHNAIQGEDDRQLIAKIFEQIADVDDQLESFIDPASLEFDIPRIKIDDIDLGMRYETVIVMFIPYEKEVVEEAARMVEREVQGTNAKEVWLAELAGFEQFSRAGRRVARDYDIHTMSTILHRMAEITLERLGDDPPDTGDLVALREIMGAYWVPKDVAQVIASALAKHDNEPDAPDQGRWGKGTPGWKLFELLAADYLAGR